jgi:predicted transcriptional regulator
MSDVIAALSTGGKRARIHDAQMVTKLPKRAKELVDEVAADREVSGSVIVREALAEYFEKRGYRK